MSKSPVPEPRKPGHSLRNGLLILGLLAVASAVAAGVYFQVQEQRRQAQLVRAAELFRLRNLAIAHLENEEPEAEEPLQRLMELVPDDPVAVRNLVIARLSAARKLEADQGPEAAVDGAAAEPPLEKLQALEPEAVSTWMLTAMRHTTRQEAQQRVAAAKKATQFGPDDPGTWYELYKALDGSFELSVDPDSVALRKEALDRIVALEPRNLQALLEQARLHSSNQDPGLLKTIASLKPLVTLIAEVVKQSSNVDPLDTLTKAEEAARKNDWPTAAGMIARSVNILRPQAWTQSDRLALDRNPLSYLAFDFLPASVLAGPPPAADVPPIPVSLVSLPDTDQPRFSAAAAGDGAIRDLAVGDFDGDLKPDVWVLGTESLEVICQGEKFGTWKEPTRTQVAAGARGILLGDLDRDDDKAKPSAGGLRAGAPEATKVRASEPCEPHPADVDAVTWGEEGLSILRNVLRDGIRGFQAVPQTRGLEKVRGVTAAILVDLDHDGDLDLALGTKDGISLWTQQDEVQFIDASARSILPTGISITSLVAVDWDKDVDIDVLYVGHSDVKSVTEGVLGVLENGRHASFRDKRLDLLQMTTPQTLKALELDGHLGWDLLCGTPERVDVHTSRINGTTTTLSFAEQYRQSPGDVLVVWDYDNDSHLDLVALDASGRILVSRGQGVTFKPVPDLFQRKPENVRRCVAADLDQDGDQDLIVATHDKGDTVSIYRNDGGNANKWMNVHTQGEKGQHTPDVNHYAIGSLVEVWSGPRYQAQTVVDEVTHFGLGQSNPEMLRIVWTNGVGQPMASPPTNAEVCRIEDPKGSCPYLYTWDGEKYVFCTDACWGAPIGLRLTERIYAGSRPWEYLTIPGDKLKLKNGRYSMQMTEELWEATYLDKCELLAIDHPAHAKICSNEKVGPPDLAAFKVHTLVHPQAPVAAVDKHGRNVLALVEKEDGRYFKGFDRRVASGVTEEHWLELDLGKLAEGKAEPPRQITLFLTGWMFPTPTAINLHLSQDSGVPPVNPPSLWVPDAKGEWQNVQPFMGFPGGKTKTIAVDLSQAFLTDDYRVRIKSTMELYWDAATFTVDDPPVETRITRLSIAAADLHYRGFSAISEPDHFGPHQYDYSQVSTAAKWPTMAGRFTRYGDVTELLKTEDNRMAIFGAGDEVTLEFDPPKDDPPEGWTRDFFLFNSGWDKDCDLHVIHSQTVEPLPFQQMSGYPFKADEDYPDTPETREYLKTYQTREQSPAAFWRRLERGSQLGRPR